jgi:hypothetical protein
VPVRHRSAVLARRAQRYDAEALRLHVQGVVELAQEVLVRDRERQLDDLLGRVQLGEPPEELVVDVFAAERDLVCVLERELLAFVVELARAVVVDVDQLGVVDAVVSADGRIEIRSERAPVQAGNPDT